MDAPKFELDPVPDGTGRHYALEVVGKRPTNIPYLRLADEDGVYFGALNEKDMLRLRDALTRALDGA